MARGTGARTGAVTGAEWRDLRFGRGVRVKPSHPTRQKRTECVPLGGEALALRQSMRSDADPAVPFLLPGKALAALKGFRCSGRRKANLEGCRLHDARHTHAPHPVSGG